MTATFHARAKGIFLAACDLAEGRRTAFLDDACAGDPRLRAAVEELLENDVRPLDFVDRAASETGGQLLAAALARGGALGSPQLPSRSPERIGRYRVLRVLGEGGMGTVYEAEQDVPRRRVAVKVIRHEGSSSRQLRRFEHEAQLLGRLNHPGIAHIYEAGTDDAGGGPRPFYAMELVQGRTLIEHARERGLGLRDKLDLFARVCDAVHHAHQNGVLHRDLKPGNILVSEDGEPKILDFGVACLLEREPGPGAALTTAGAVIGTLAYMSPEQVSSDSDHLDTRSDIYSLGVIAYELLSGTLPYDVLDAPIPKAARLICEAEPARLAVADFGMRADLQTILATALAKERDQRYASAAELAADVRRVLRDEAIMARPASTLYQLRKFARRNRTLVAGIGLAAGALVAGTIVSSSLAHRESVQRARADDKTAEAHREAYRANVLAAGLALSTDNPRFARERLSTLEPAEGGWEYGRLKRLTEQWLASLDGQVKHIWLVAFESEGRRAVAVAADGSVLAWDLESGAHSVRVPGAHERDGPRAISADGRRCVSVRDGSPVLWDTATGTELAVLRAPGNFRLATRNTGAFSPDGKRVVISPQDRGAFLFDLEAGGEPRELRVEQEVGALVAFSGNGKTVATIGGTRMAAWDAATGGLLRRLEPVADRRSIAVDHDGIRIAVGAADGVHLFDVSSGRETRVLTGHTDAVTSLAFGPDPRWLAAQQEDGSTWVWDCSTGEILHKYWDGLPTWKTSLAWSPDGACLLTGTHLRARLRLWDARQTRDTEALRGHTSYVYPVMYTADGTRIASGSWDDTVRLWNAATGEPLAVLRGHRERITDLASAPDGSRLASVSIDGEVVVWDAWTGLRLAAARVGPEAMSVAWSPDGARIAVGTNHAQASILLLDARTLTASGSLDALGAPVRSLDFSPDGTRLVAGLAGTAAEEWDVVGRRRIAEHKPIRSISCARWSPDGNEIVLAGGGGFLAIVDAANLEVKRELVAHPREVFSAEFSPDGTRIFSGGREGRLCVWDAASGVLVGQFEGHREYIWSLAVSPDGSRVATGSGDFTVRQWESQPVRETFARRKRETELEGRARPMVEGLFTELADPTRVVERLKSSSGLAPELRTAALLVALGRAGSASGAGAK